MAVVSTTLIVERAAPGTTATLISASAPEGRRTIRNVGTVTVEIGPPTVTYGTGHPIGANESFTFDEGGRISGPIYGVVQSGTGATSTLSF